jgi:hypothetical protein
MTEYADQLQWQIAPGFTVVLDADNGVVAEVAGQRAPVIRPDMAIEAFRQARVAQGGAGRFAEFRLFEELTVLRAFVQDIAAMRKDGEPDDGGEPYDGSDGRAMDLLDGIVGQARVLLGIDPKPEPEPLLPLPPMTSDAETTRPDIQLPEAGQ